MRYRLHLYREYDDSNGYCDFKINPKSVYQRLINFMNRGVRKVNSMHTSIL